MSIFNKEPQLQQTEFSESQAVLEREVEVPVEKQLCQKVSIQNGDLFYRAGATFLVICIVLDYFFIWQTKWHCVNRTDPNARTDG